MDDFAIKVENVSKVFKLPHEKNSSIKSAVVNFYKRKKGYELQRALSNVSLEIKNGEFFGIVGRNGSGKSTLLKLLAGIYTPTRGQVHVRGSLTPFIELGVGFNPELTGRENVYLNGALLGFNRKEMTAMYPDIVEFAELERFMDQKLKNYSSGMQVRLAFSIAIRAQSDILLIDEVLAVGDSAFQRKCFDYFEELKRTNRTVVLVSHDMDSVKRFCTKAALISNSRVEFIGSPDQAAELYDQLNASDIKLSQEHATIKEEAEINSLVIKSNKSKKFDVKDDITIQIKASTTKRLKAVVGLQLVKDDGQFIAGISSQFQIKPQEMTPGKGLLYEFTFPSDQLVTGTYSVDGVIYDAEVPRPPVFYKQGMATFTTIGTERGWGQFTLKGAWKSTK